MVRFAERAIPFTVWAVGFALVVSPVAASLCGVERSDEKAMECCKDMAHCNMADNMETCCNPEGRHQTGDASAALAISAKQKSLTDGAVLESEAPVSASVAYLSARPFLPEASYPLPRHPLIKPLRI